VKQKSDKMNNGTCIFLCTLILGAATALAKRDITFVSISDLHYRQADHEKCNNYRMPSTLKELNSIHAVEWPSKLGGGNVGLPRGVVALGDLIDDGALSRDGRDITAEQFHFFEKDFGVYGEGTVKFPVFEGWGNHDGGPEGTRKNGAFSVQCEIKRRNHIRLERNLISNLSTNGLHYSWDWDDVHFVQLNLYPGDEHKTKKTETRKQADGTVKEVETYRYDPIWHNPQGALSFLREDLEKNVGTSGRPVVLMSHCGFDTDWWAPPAWGEFYAVAKPYNVVLYLYGHTGTGIKPWAPQGETKILDCINDGHGDLGFFVILITDDKIRAAYRRKETKGGVQSWTWDCLFEKQLKTDSVQK
jgi:cytolysin (calcineurin-like family phosphatase)